MTGRRRPIYPDASGGSPGGPRQSPFTLTGDDLGHAVNARKLVRQQVVVPGLYFMAGVDERQQLDESDRVDVPQIEEVDFPSESWVIRTDGVSGADERLEAVSNLIVRQSSTSSVVGTAER